MATELSWLVESRVLWIQYVDHVTMDELQAVMAQASEILLADGADLEIHTIADMSKMKSLPSNLAQLGAMMNIFKHVRGLIVMVVPEKNALMRFLASYASKMTSKSGRMFSVYSLQEAAAVLKERAPELQIAQ